MPKRFPEAARRVSRLQIKGFYETCGKGIFDSDVIDDLGVSLYARCQSMLGHLHCPDCSEPVSRMSRSMECSRCSWSCTWDEFRRTPSGAHLWPGRMEPFIREFANRYPTAKTPRDKAIIIDTLIHHFHGEMDEQSKPGAYNLIEGELIDIVAFLDEISYGEKMPADIEERRAAWRARTRSASGFWSRQLSQSDQS